jgi:hypothetical protein
MANHSQSESTIARGEDDAASKDARTYLKIEGGSRSAIKGG